MRYVTTIHLDNASTSKDYINAANRLCEVMGEPNGSKAEFVAKIVFQWRHMVKNLSSPFEVRVGSLQSEPIIIVHPGTREAGIKARREAIENGTWGTSVYEQRARQAANYGKSRLSRED